MGRSMHVEVVARTARHALWYGSLILGVAGTAEGQEASRLRVAVHASEPTLPDLSSSRSVVVSGSTRGHRILRGAGIGLLAGATAGLGVAAVLGARRNPPSPPPSPSKT